MERNGKNRGRTGCHHCSALAGNTLFKGGYEMETHHSNAHFSIYGMGDAPAFMIK
jgi:hypothetical protein